MIIHAIPTKMLTACNHKQSEMEISDCIECPCLTTEEIEQQRKNGKTETDLQNAQQMKNTDAKKEESWQS